MGVGGWKKVLGGVRVFERTVSLCVLGCAFICVCRS